MTTTRIPTAAAFEALCKLEPVLLELLRECQFYREQWPFRRSWQRAGKVCCWEGSPRGPFLGIKPRLKLLVGHGRQDGDDILGSAQAYEVATQVLLKELGA